LEKPACRDFLIEFENSSQYQVLTFSVQKSVKWNASQSRSLLSKLSELLVCLVLAQLVSTIPMTKRSDLWERPPPLPPLGATPPAAAAAAAAAVPARRSLRPFLSFIRVSTVSGVGSRRTSVWSVFVLCFVLCLLKKKTAPTSYEGDSSPGGKCFCCCFFPPGF